MTNLELLSNALSYIEMHLCDCINLEEIAASCYCSKSGLQKLFRNVYQCSVKEYIIKRRITRAARELVSRPELTVLEIALAYGYSSHEAFTRAFEQVWNCSPSVFRTQYRFTDIYPRFILPIKDGDDYMKHRKPLDITELYDLFCARKDCYFVCCDIKSLCPINEISRKAGDLAILECARRMEASSGDEDIVFRIGGDEFALLTCSSDKAYAEQIAERILAHNGETIAYEDRMIPLHLYASVTRFEGNPLKYNQLFSSLHKALLDSKSV